MSSDKRKRPERLRICPVPDDDGGFGVILAFLLFVTIIAAVLKACDP